MGETVGFVGLEKRIHDPVRVYSHGMRQRLALAQALLPWPEVILLDEPAEGLDPEGIHEMRDLILRLNRERGLTVLLSSHLLAEVEQVCDRVAILNRGRLVFQGRWSELAGEPVSFRLEVDDWAKAAGADSGLRRHGDCGPMDRSRSRPGPTCGRSRGGARQAGVRVRAVEPLRQYLEEIYLRRRSAPRMSTAFVFQLRNELVKLFARKRTYIGFGAFLLVEGWSFSAEPAPSRRRRCRRT